MKGHYYRSIKTEDRGEGNTELICECGLRIYTLGLVRALNLHAEHVGRVERELLVVELERAVN